jgi:hypothetical protein
MSNLLLTEVILLEIHQSLGCPSTSPPIKKTFGRSFGAQGDGRHGNKPTLVTIGYFW